MCERPDFERAQNTATELLLHQDITSFFIDVRNFRFDKPIKIDSVPNYAKVVMKPITDFTCNEFSGCCVILHPSCILILYDDEEPNECRKHWGIAHEVGHIYLGHTADGEKEEKEAHFFTAQVVMPEIVLHNLEARCNGIDPYEISKVFNASFDSACRRLDTFQRRGCFSSSTRDKLLLSIFRPLLDEMYPPEGSNKKFWDMVYSA